MDRVLVITGASRGIGRAAAQVFLNDGYRVINLSRSSPRLDRVEHINADLADPNWTGLCATRLQQAVGQPAILTVIHCAGFLQKDSIGNLQVEDMHRVLQINVAASVQLNQLLLPMMKPGSSIIYIGSTLSEKAVANACSYVVSKHAVIGLMRSTCQDLAGQGIHTMCVCPGFTETEMLLEHVGNSQQILQDIAAGVTFGRLIEPEEIATTLHFCALNPVLNGAVIHANLGQIEQ